MKNLYEQIVNKINSLHFASNNQEALAFIEKYRSHFPSPFDETFSTEDNTIEVDSIFNHQFPKTFVPLAKIKWARDQLNYLIENYDTLLEEELNKDWNLLNGKIKIQQKLNTTGFSIYKYVDKNNEIVYIGQSIRLKQRLQEHTKDQLANFEGDIYYFNAASKEEMDMMERYLIGKYRPIYNTIGINSVFNIEIQEPEWIKIE